MSVVSGNFFDLGGYPMGLWMSTLTFELSGPATHEEEGKSLVSSARRRSAVVDLSTGEWVTPIVSTEGMPQDRYYTVTETSLDSEAGMSLVRTFPWKIRVPEGIWRFPDLVRDWSSPIAVGISEDPPELLPQYWLDPTTGDFYRKKA